MRIGRFPVPETSGADDPAFVPGTATRLRDGDDVTVIAIGTMVSRALTAADQLRTQGVHVRVLNMASIEPLDVHAILDASHETRGIVTAEEATITGGLGAAVASVLAQQHPTPMRILGIPRVFAPTGSTEFLLDYFGLNAAGIVRAVHELLAADDR
jgi:transketolase